MCHSNELLELYQNFHHGLFSVGLFATGFAGAVLVVLPLPAVAAGLASAFSAPVAWPVTLSFRLPF
jgi:hypothetical protein